MGFSSWKVVLEGHPPFLDSQVWYSLFFPCPSYEFSATREKNRRQETFHYFLMEKDVVSFAATAVCDGTHAAREEWISHCQNQGHGQCVYVLFFKMHIHLKKTHTQTSKHLVKTLPHMMDKGQYP